MKKNIFAIFSILAATLVFASFAAATPITLTYNNVLNATTINATMYGNTSNYTVGQMQLTIDGQSAIKAFCVDPAYASTSPQAYDLRAIDPNSSYAKAAYLLSQSTASTAAATQIAVWKTVFGSNFTWNNPNATLLNSVNSILATLTTPPPATFKLSNYSLAVSPGNAASGLKIGYQDFLVDMPSPVVPEPSTIILFGLGLAGAFYMKRRGAKA